MAATEVVKSTRNYGDHAVPIGQLKQVPIGTENEGGQPWGEIACCFARKGILIGNGGE